MSVITQSLESSCAKDASMTVTDMLLSAAEHHSRSGICVVSDERAPDALFISYPQLLEQAKAILGGLQPQAGGPGAKVVLLLDRPQDFIPAFWACLLGGYVPCPLAQVRDPERWASHLEHVNSLLEHPLFISTGVVLRELPESIRTTDLDVLRGSASAPSVHHAAPEDIAVLMLTSGSTGYSKAVALTHANLTASMEGRAERQRLSSADTTFNWVAFDHVAALLESHMIALHVGAHQLHTQPETVLANPLRFLTLIHRHRVTVAFAPNFLLGQVIAAVQSATSLDPGGALSLDLSCLRRIVTGGEANVVDTGRRFLDLLTPYGLPHNALWPAFGMTETCAACVYSHEFPEVDAHREFAAVGLPIEGLEIRIAHEHGECLAGEPGELQLRGTMIFRCYYNNEEATRAAFTCDGWFRTGDVGCIEGGRLRLLARNKDSIIVNGVNYFSHELETKLEQLQGLERSFVAAFPTRPKGADTEQLVVAFSTSLPEDNEDALYQLIVAVRNTTIMLWGFRPAAVLPLPKSAFPKTSLGKIQRSLMRKRFESGAFDPDLRRVETITRAQAGAYTAPEGPIEAGITQVFARILGMDPGVLSTSASFFDLGGTSLDIMKLAQALQRFGLKATVPLVLQNPTVQRLGALARSGEQSNARFYDPIIPLQLSGRKTPLFCVHPGNGEVFVLVNVAKYFLNDRPFYALRPRGFNEGEECFQSVAEMVRTYAEAILARQPHGPFAVAGYSLGCPIAFEVARELQARGHEIGFLGAIDFWPCYERTSLDFHMATGLALVLDLITRAQFLELNKDLRPVTPDRQACERVFRLASPARIAELDLDLQKFYTWARVAHAIETMMFAHVNTGKAKEMTIFCSEGISRHYGGIEWTRQSWREQLEHWSAFVERPRYVDVPGTHHILMGPKYVAAFQAVLRAEIDRALGGR